MKIIFSRLSLNALLFLLIPSFNANCSLENIKGTYDILSDNYKHLSLVHGAAAWEIGVIKRMYDFGQIFPVYKEEDGHKTINGYINLENTHKTVQLIHALFYRIPGSTGESDFTETKLLKIHDPIQVAKTAAQILALVHKIKRQGKKVKVALNDIRVARRKLLTSYDQLRSLDKELWSREGKALSQFIRQLSAEDKKLLNERSDINKQLYFIDQFDKEPTRASNYDNMLKGVKIENVKLFQTFQKKLLELQKLFETLLTQSPLTLIKPSIVQVVFDSLQECNSNNKDVLYPAYTTEMVLLAFVYKKCSYDRMALKIFYEELDSKLSVKQKGTRTGKKVLIRQLDDDWINDVFEHVNQKTALDKLNDIFNPKDKKKIVNRIDEILYYTQQIRSLPQPVGYTKAVYEYDQGKQTQPFSNCTCNMIRNLMNILSYDATQNRFDLAILKKRLKRENDSFSPALEAFYKEFHKVNDASSSKVHNAWIKVISSIPYAAYDLSPEVVAEAYGGYIIIPSADYSNDLLQKFLTQKRYILLNNNQHGYELKPSVRNVIIILNHLLDLKLFEKAEHGLAGEFGRSDFVKTYFPALARSLNLKDGSFYQALFHNATGGDTTTDFDDQDFKTNMIYSTLSFPALDTNSVPFTCELMTQYPKHAELFLRSQESKTVDNLVTMMKNQVKRVHNSSLRLIFTNALCKKSIDLKSTLTGRKSKEIFLNLFAIHLENSNFLDQIISQTFSLITSNDSLKIKSGINNLLLAAAEQYPNERMKQLKKLKILNNFVSSLNNTDIVEATKNKMLENTFEAVQNSLQSQDAGVPQAGIIILTEFIGKGYQGADKQIIEIASKEVENSDANMREAALNLFAALVKNQKKADPALFEKATVAAKNGMLETMLGVRQSALALFQALFDKNYEEARKHAVEIAETGAKNQHKGIQQSALNLQELLNKGTQQQEKVSDTSTVTRSRRRAT